MALFGKAEEKSSAATAGTPPPRREEDRVRREGEMLQTIIGKGSEFEGKLTFEGQVVIEGKFNGQINTRDVLIVGPSARVQAEVIAGTVVVNGTVEGNIKAAQLVDLKQSGRVKGNIESPAISVEKGAIFEGSCKMEGIGKGTPAPAPEAPKK